MKERPILFNAEMVRAILDGRKTQTRRIVKDPIWTMPNEIFNPRAPHRYGDVSTMKPCPQGGIGDRLWVRETWALHPDEHPSEAGILYRATDPGWDTAGTGLKRKPSIHMPRWASRITLEITGIRVERLNDISRGDAMEEGCSCPNMAYGPDPRQWFTALWESIYGEGSWNANPYVWVLEFHKREVVL